jgi:abortive infection bacteriophage resistance protein
MAEALKVINLIRHICIHTMSFIYITKFQNNNKVKVTFKITALVAIFSKIQNGGGAKRH